ncbi:response regulator transcription factor [Gaiella sp.]|uniref:helix-turn-helix transcriptional regulator n=1 Tax=Gaiella sp. TaxID=2663207 RepID=UPI0039838BEB
MRQLARSDYEAVLSFLAEAHAVEEPEPFTPHLLDRLASLTHSEAATFFEYAPETHIIDVYVPSSNERPKRLGVDHGSWTSARTVELRRWKARSTGPVALSDVFPRRLRVEPEFNLNYREYGSADEIGVPLDRHRHWTAQVGVFRLQDFGERERLIFQLLQPHLAALYRVATLRRRLGVTADTERLLTTREREVMTHVSSGLTNAQIARVLVIEPSTVRKHLEHVFEKLGVSSRTAAVAKLRAEFTDTDSARGAINGESRPPRREARYDHQGRRQPASDQTREDLPTGSP